MPNVLGTIRKFHTENFTVVVDAFEDYDIDLSWDEDGEVREKLESGEYIGFCARARVLFDGKEIGCDYLGGCIYESLEAFADHRECGRQNREYAAKGKAGRCGSYFADMIHSSIAEARKHLIRVQAVKVRKTA